MNIEKERKKFEAWFTSTGRKISRWSNKYHSYTTLIVDVTYRSWQARAALVAEYQSEESESDAYTIDAMSKLLAGIAIAIKGPEEALKRHGYQDLIALVSAKVFEVEILKSGRALPVIEQEPVAYAADDGTLYYSTDMAAKYRNGRPLYDHPQPSAADSLMVDIDPPATSRDRWMYKQGQMAECDPRSHAPSAYDARDITIILSSAYDEIAYLHSKIMQHAGIESDGRSNSVCVAINEFLVAMEGTK